MGKYFFTNYEMITFCRFFAASQQAGCKGFEKGMRNHCRWWLDHGSGVYHCTNPEAQAAAILDFKSTHMEAIQ